MKTLTYGSLFSGTECMSAAAIGLPLVPRFFAEVEPYPCAILRSKFPNVPNLGDVTKIKYDSSQRTLSNGYDPATCPDAPRFKVCGNGMCANQVRWILLNLLHAENINPWYLEENE